ncbi:hypothetical protein HU200_002347 [Digitaria exilis]|uniref:P-type ATPase N-terminal domain-containing protein n=1 Tax=Digitaria exilis TaxID=1010633 RepID=A0A835KVL6_9POAL|nr:hypothetical protein HU200_002347 [Digitaria exilis]
MAWSVHGGGALKTQGNAGIFSPTVHAHCLARTATSTGWRNHASTIVTRDPVVEADEGRDDLSRTACPDVDPLGGGLTDSGFVRGTFKISAHKPLPEPAGTARSKAFVLWLRKRNPSPPAAGAARSRPFLTAAGKARRAEHTRKSTNGAVVLTNSSCQILNAMAKPSQLPFLFFLPVRASLPPPPARRATGPVTIVTPQAPSTSATHPRSLALPAKTQLVFYRSPPLLPSPVLLCPHAASLRRSTPIPIRALDLCARAMPRNAAAGDSGLPRAPPAPRRASPRHGGGPRVVAAHVGVAEGAGDEDARVVRVGDADRTNERLDFAGNAVRTAKYSPLTFLPRNLFEQFHRLAYVYFLAIAVLNQLPQLAVFGRGASVMPLAFVLIVTAVKDAYEDWRRHRSDRAENGRLAAVLSPSDEGAAPDVRVGDVVRVVSDESLPADMVLLATSEPTGVAYVQTLNLDGESNLKTRYAKQETLSTPPERLAGAVVRCERPNRNIYGFQANLELEGESRRIPLGPSNIVLRGCELKNTAWAVGVVVYAGRETKAMLNNAGAPKKRSHRRDPHEPRDALPLRHPRRALHDRRHALRRLAAHPRGGARPRAIVFIFLMAVIVFQIMIPISLYISMELVRLGQAYFMIRDTKLFDESSNTRFQCRALNINEDLGQIKCIFSDKTGTLTQNKMGVPLVKLIRDGGDTEQGRQTREFFLALATCNTIVPMVTDGPDPRKKVIDYQGESPDEQALVSAAAAKSFRVANAYEKPAPHYLDEGIYSAAWLPTLRGTCGLLGASGIEDKLQMGT